MTIDLTSALEAHYRANPDERGDEAFAHVSDLFGCNLATWARRQGKPQLPFDQRTRTKFALGNAVEDHIADALAEQLQTKGYRLVRGEVVALQFDVYDGELRGVPFCEDGMPDDVIVGHLDYALEHEHEPPIVVEVKSTSFLKGKMPTEAREHYIIQGAAYAIAKGAERFAVFIVCRESGKVAEFWFYTRDYVAEVKRRAMFLLALTGPDAFPPEAAPPYAWQCSYCRFAECDRNKNRGAA